MLGEGGVEVVGAQREMYLVVAEVVGLGAVAQPGQLHGVGGVRVADEYELEAAVGGLVGGDRLQPERLGIEFEAAVKVENVEVVVFDFEVHGKYPF